MMDFFLLVIVIFAWAAILAAGNSWTDAIVKKQEIRTGYPFLLGVITIFLFFIYTNIV